MILTDNAVEQMVKTYLSLPRRVNGLHIPRKRRDEMEQSFPALLDGLEEFASDKLDGIDLGNIEWYHRLRNELYHQGFGLTVSRDQVEVYVELAHVLFKNLFGFELPGAVSPAADRLGYFLSLWNRLEIALIELAQTHSLTGHRHPNLIAAAQFLEDGAILPPDDIEFIDEARRIRNNVVHGQAAHREALTQPLIDRLETLVDIVEEIEGIEPDEGAV